MLKLLVARHGNTFDKGDVILRVGRGTDLPLSKSGIEQAIQLGHYLKNHHPHIDHVLVSQLQRTKQTAEYALKTMQSNATIAENAIFNEIDYGIDEGKPESEVIARLGVKALNDWDKSAIVPKDWRVNPSEIQAQWQAFAESLQGKNQTVLVVTSNGVARFIGSILANPDQFMQSQNIKLSTGAVSCFRFENNEWQCDYWNARPEPFSVSGRTDRQI